MRIPHFLLPHLRLVVVAAFTAACAGLFGYLWVNSGGRLPLITGEGYRVTIELAPVSNLVYDSDVRMAGVKVGKITALGVQGNKARAELELQSNYPLHEGVRVEVRNKTLIEESYLDITDGNGAVIPGGAELPAEAGRPAVELDDVLRSLDKPTRDSLGQLVRSAGASTADSGAALSRAVAGLGNVGRQGATVMDALAEQSDDLHRLTGQTATLLAALDTREGEIAQLVSDSHAVFSATAKNRDNVAATMRTLPGLLSTVHGASGDLSRLSTALGPIAADLNAAAPDLSAALTQLPDTSKDLRALLPSLQGVVDKVPDTLTRVPQVADDTSELVKTANVSLSDLNPMLSYVRPYGRDVAAFFTNFAALLNRGDINGKILRIFMVYNEQAFKAVPVDTNRLPMLDKSNAYPAPGQAANPGPFRGKYPRLEQDPPR